MTNIILTTLPIELHLNRRMFRTPLTLACHRLELELSEARGFDKLPSALLERAKESLVHSIDRDELLRTLGVAVELLLHQATKWAIWQPASKCSREI
jgi:hypothetical protein